MIRAIIFDFGGLFNTGSLRAALRCIAEQHGKNAVRILEISRAAWDDAKIGDDESFWQTCAEYCGISPDDFFNEFLEQFVFDNAMLKYAKQLSSQYRLAMLTNNARRWFEHYRAKYQLDALFSCIVASYEIRVAKPDERAYRYVLKELNVAAQECVYVDDSVENVEAAAKIGMRIVQYTTIEELREEIKKFIARS